MSKYINADELINQLEEYRSNIDDDYADGKNKIIDVARILIAEMPAVNVIEESAITETFLKAYCRKIAEAVISEIGAGGEREGTE